MIYEKKLLELTKWVTNLDRPLLIISVAILLKVLRAMRIMPI
jgi:hypothetical protein